MREGRSKLDAPLLAADDLGVEVGDDEAGVAAVGEPNVGGGHDREGVVAVAADELVGFGVSMRQRGLDQGPREEANLAGGEGVVAQLQGLVEELAPHCGPRRSAFTVVLESHLERGAQGSRAHSRCPCLDAIEGDESRVALREGAAGGARGRFGLTRARWRELSAFTCSVCPRGTFPLELLRRRAAETRPPSAGLVTHS